MKPKKRKKVTGEFALKRLEAYLNSASKEPMRWLAALWKEQENALTYSELRNAVMRGYLDTADIQRFQQSYAKYVNQTLAPAWAKSMGYANEILESAKPGFRFNASSYGVKNWIEQNGARWVTDMTNEQRKAIRAMTQYANSGAWTVDELGRSIRPCIGLNSKQAMANLRYENHVRESLLKNNPNMRPETAAKRARDAAAKYAAQQHRYRADTIATTELAFAHSWGEDAGIRQAIEQGLLGKVEKVWSTARDELVCSACGGLEGRRIAMDAEFDYKGKVLFAGQKRLTPAHPRCRCTIIYEEVEPPTFSDPSPLSTMPNQGIIETRGIDAVDKKALFEKIDNTPNYSSIYASKLKETFEYFESCGYILREHALNRMLGQKKGRDKRPFTREDIMFLLDQPVNYTQDDGRIIRFYDYLYIVQARDNLEILSVGSRIKPPQTWKEV